jgi:hypothetical protein
MILQAIDKFHKTRAGYLVFGLVELALAAVVANAAFDSGNLWQWTVAFVGLFGFVQNVGRAMAVHTK